MTIAKIYDGTTDSTDVTESEGIIQVYGQNGSYGNTYGPTTVLGNAMFLQSPGVSDLIQGNTVVPVTFVKELGVPILSFDGYVIIQGV
jgi:hypothetical protein